MKTIPPAHAEHQLTAVTDRFEAWRQTRTTRGEPIPPHLWEQAIVLTTRLSITRVARRLRVSGGELKKRCATHPLPRRRFIMRSFSLHSQTNDGVSSLLP